MNRSNVSPEAIAADFVRSDALKGRDYRTIKGGRQYYDKEARVHIDCYYEKTSVIVEIGEDAYKFSSKQLFEDVARAQEAKPVQASMFDILGDA